MSESMPEPTKAGTVVRVHTSHSKYPEIWVASYINQGRWYPDTDSWLGGSARHDHPDGCGWYELTKRGRVVLLTAGDAEAYGAGWQAACKAIAAMADDMAHEVPYVGKAEGERRDGGER